jgi:hypothetical protein
MMSDEITRMMEQYANEAVKIAREQFGTELDYSEESLQEVEGILDQLAALAASEKPSNEAIDEMSKAWGGYFGEVVRKRWGGEWMIDTYPGGEFLIVTLHVNGSKLYPSMKVNRRLTRGSNDNLWQFYELVRSKFDGAPGARIQ